MPVVAAGYEAVAELFSACVPVDGPGGAFSAVVDGVTVLDVWQGTVGDGGSPWRNDTVCVIASGTKGVVATAMLMLIEQGALELDSPVTRYWPEFGSAGKAEVRVSDIVAHTAGLPGIVEPVAVGDLADPPRIEALLAAQEAIVPVGTPTYHALTYGWLCDALVRRVNGRSVARFVADEIVAPLALDLSIGTPPERAMRAAPLRPVATYALSAFLADGERDPRLAYVYGNPPVPGRISDPSLLAFEVPGANAVTNARSMARLYGCLARGGELDGLRLLTAETVALGRATLSAGPDPLTGRELRFGVGFELAPNPSPLGPAPDAFGHTGAGGSSHGAWPGLRTGFSFATSQLRPETDDGRAHRLLAALYEVVHTT